MLKDGMHEMLSNCANSKERKLMLKETRRYMETDNKKYDLRSFTEIPIPEKFIGNPKSPFKIFRSRDYLVQLFKDSEHVRISVNVTRIKDSGHWEEGISWETLMEIKRLLGYGDFDAVEVYPRDADEVNIANIRHLFILNDSLPFIWRSKK